MHRHHHPGAADHPYTRPSVGMGMGMIQPDHIGIGLSMIHSDHGCISRTLQD